MLRRLAFTGLAPIALLSYASNAGAWCIVEDTFQACYPEQTDPDGYEVFIGSDPNDNFSQWVGWRNVNTDQCYWDRIGDAAGFYVNTTVNGSWMDDEIKVVGPGGVWFCGYFIDVPIYGGRRLNLIGDEGADKLRSYAGGAAGQLLYGGPGSSLVNESGAGHDLIVTDRADVIVFGDLGWDLISIFGNGSGGVFAGGKGNDILNVKKTATPFNQMCDEGTQDKWCGPGAKPPSCEIQTTQCNGF